VITVPRLPAHVRHAWLLRAELPSWPSQRCPDPRLLAGVHTLPRSGHPWEAT
jgi:hypothetical protein